MAPSHSRQLLVWTLPTIAALLSYLWYKKKRIGARSDTGGTKTRRDIEKPQLDKSLEEELKEAEKSSPMQTSPKRSFSRSLSGVDTAPIDIVFPPELRSIKSTPIVISDEDLDLEIEKIKSMKNGTLSKSRPDNSPLQASKPKTSSPVQETMKDKKVTVTKCESIRKEEAQMEQKDTDVGEEKLASLKIDSNRDAPKQREHENHDQHESTENKKVGDDLRQSSGDDLRQSSEDDLRQNSGDDLRQNSGDDLRQNSGDDLRKSSERDSANHSPADVMLASPSLSSISDNHSERSNDSGKGGSDAASPPPSRSPVIEDPEVPCDINETYVYEFVIPQNLVGKLIGRHGCFVTQIRDKTNAHIIVKKHPTNIKLKVCSIEGTQSEIDHALSMVRDKFPAKRYPEVTLEEVHFPNLISLTPLNLPLVEDIDNDTVLSCMVAPNHLFLQQPTHPSFPSLNILNNNMNLCYSAQNSPLLPDPIPKDCVCAAFSVNSWYRAMVLSTDTETDTSVIRFLDVGGYAVVENSNLRQIRGDFVFLPYQAAECILANIRSVNEDGTWPQEAYDLVAEVASGKIIYTRVAGYTDNQIPLVLCCVVVGPQSVVFLNQHLVEHGYAEWIPNETDEPPAEEIVEGAVGGENA